MTPNFLYHIKGLLFSTGFQWDKKAPSTEKAIEFAHAHINEEPTKYQANDSHKYSIEYQLAHFGDAINTRFRKDRPNKDDLNIADEVNKHSTDTDLVLYRGVKDGIFDIMKTNAKTIGNCDLYEKGFLACSLVKGHELKTKHKLRIYVPAGSKVIYQGNVNNEQNFYEVDIMHSSRLKIESIDSNYINCRLLGTA